MSVFFIAEAGVNHNGDEQRALQMVDVAADAGADAVKFQTFSADRLVNPSARKAAYQERETGGGSQHAMLKALEMSEQLHERLFERCEHRGIEFMSTPFDEQAADMLLALGMQRLKIPSGEITNLPFLRYLARKGQPLILSTGMATMEEVQEALAAIDEAHRDTDSSRQLVELVTVLHCTSNYPAEPADVNLRAMTTIAEATGVPVGYSDHTLGAAVSTAAVALGACVIEKHFTLDRALPGPDHRASLEPGELADLVRQVRTIEQALGSPLKGPTEAELEVRAVARRSICAGRNIALGTALAAEDLVMLRPGTGITPKHLELMLGRRLVRNIGVGEQLDWSDLAS